MRVRVKPGVGHNSLAADSLKAIIQRVEKLEEEKKAIGEDVKEIYAEAKGNGFDTKIIKMIIRLRKMDAASRAEEQALLDLYLHALGMDLAP
jgi:uncharacterized protein (UPF0335 family)